MENLGDLPGGAVESSAMAASSDGSVVVGGSSSAASRPNLDEAFRWTREGGMRGLGFLPGGDVTLAYDVSADGSVVVGGGYTARGTNLISPFIWTEQGGMRDLQRLLTDDLGLNLGGWDLGIATAVSADGTVISGNGTNPQGASEAWRAVIPEPGTLSLLTLGVMVLSNGSRRRTRRFGSGRP
jgi:uncharacterized membrane protein